MSEDHPDQGGDPDDVDGSIAVSGVRAASSVGPGKPIREVIQRSMAARDAAGLRSSTRLANKSKYCVSVPTLYASQFRDALLAIQSHGYQREFDISHLVFGDRHSVQHLPKSPGRNVDADSRKASAQPSRVSFTVRTAKNLSHRAERVCEFAFMAPEGHHSGRF